MTTPDAVPHAVRDRPGKPTMPDMMWIAIMIGLVAATLAYVRLCDDA